MPLYLGVDGGGTGCRAAVADASGRVLGQAVSGPANVSSDLDGSVRNILAAAEAALTMATGAAAMARELPRLHAGLGLAGANGAGVVEALKALLPFQSPRIETDAVTAVKGALRGGDGIVAALGTGSVFASQRNGVLRPVGGWGLVLGDEGSGAVIGRSALSLALRAVDGLAPMTPLIIALIAEHGGPAGIIRFAQSARPADFAALAPRLLASDDPAAVGIVARALADVAEAIDHLQADAPVPVTFIGGLAAAYSQRLAGRWALRAPAGTALDGALMLAREAG